MVLDSTLTRRYAFRIVLLLEPTFQVATCRGLWMCIPCVGLCHTKILQTISFMASLCRIAEDEATGQDGVGLHHRKGHLGGGITI